MKVKKLELIRAVTGRSLPLENILDEVIGHQDSTNRITVSHFMVVKDNDTGKHYGSVYFVGATPEQEIYPYDCCEDIIELDEIELVPGLRWEPVSNNDIIDPQ